MMHVRLPALTAWPAMGRGPCPGLLDDQASDRKLSPMRCVCSGGYGQ